MHKPLTTLISDCDGVLIDSEVIAFQVLIEQASSVFTNIDVGAQLSHSFGQKTESLVQQLANVSQQAIPEGFLKNLRNLTDAQIMQTAQPIQGVEILINQTRLKAVVSNSGTARVQAATTLVGVLQRDDVLILSADEVRAPKPAPDLYLLAAQRLSVLAEQCLVIEDSISGIVAAKAAGMRVIGFTGGAHIPAGHDLAMRAAGVCAVFGSMQELPQLLQEIAGWDSTPFKSTRQEH